jgi:tRNA 2-thiouridine synthesizing protein E
MQTSSVRQAHSQQASILFDEDGFLIDPSHWTEELARELAEAAGIPQLNGAHWQVIHFIRERHLRCGAMPPMRIICRQLGTERDAVRGLFGGCRQLWRIAGLPNPGEEAKTYMD